MTYRFRSTDFELDPRPAPVLLPTERRLQPVGPTPADQRLCRTLPLGLALLLVIPIILIGAVAALVVISLATVAAANGQSYRYSLTLRLVR